MFFKEPIVEFVAINSNETVTTSGGTGGVDSCNGPTSQSRNCDYFNLTMLDNCGYYNKTEMDENS